MTDAGDVDHPVPITWPPTGPDVNGYFYGDPRFSRRHLAPVDTEPDVPPHPGDPVEEPDPFLDFATFMEREQEQDSEERAAYLAAHPRSPVTPPAPRQRRPTRLREPVWIPLRERARRLEGPLDAVRNGEDGNRNNLLNWAGWVLRQDLAAGRLDARHSEIAKRLLEAGRDAGLEYGETDRTTRSGLGEQR